MSIVKNLFISMCIILYTYVSNAQQPTFEWLNKDLKKFEKFDLSSRQYFQKEFTGNYQSPSNFEIVDFDIRDFPLDKGIIATGFNIAKHLTYFTFPGTGYVFLFDRTKNTLTRLDQTFYRGYNFNALQFYRNGTIYSLGGGGFWHVNALLTYFDFKRKEWEVIDTFGDVKPLRISNLFAGYNKARDKVYVIEQKEEFSVTSSGKQRVFSLDLKTLQWEYKGDIDLVKLSKFNLDLLESTWLGDVFYFHVKPENAIIADPESNELFVYKGSKKLFFGSDQHNFFIGDKVYSLMPQFTKARTVEVLDSMSFSELKKDLKKIEIFYSKDLFPITSRDIIIFILVILVFILAFLPIRKKSKKQQTLLKAVTVEKTVWDLLSVGGHAVLGFVLENGCDYKFTTEEISKILGCDKKAFDTQRQYRSKFISNFNSFFEEHFMIEQAIYRISSEEDKRFVCYQLAEEAVDAYRKFIRSIE